MHFGFVSVTIYDTLGPDVVEYIVNHADVKTIVVSQLMVMNWVFEKFYRV
jgi:long-subunit acyl-CoA synthetase (AMP-forming)